jgi:hypothetical protein
MLSTGHNSSGISAIPAFDIPRHSIDGAPQLLRRPCILCFGHDEILLQTRRWMLEREFHVDVAKDLENVSRLADERPIDLLILCHTLQEEECQQAISLVRTLAPKSRILAFAKLNGNPTCAGYDERIDCLDGPHSLISQVIELLRPIS